MGWLQYAVFGLPWPLFMCVGMVQGQWTVCIHEEVRLESCLLVCVWCVCVLGGDVGGHDEKCEYIALNSVGG